MSDYLSRAAERASSIPAGVRPVLPSPFDSESSSFAPALVEAENTPRVEPSRNIADEQVASVGERVAAIKTLWTEPAQPAPRQTSEAGAKQTSVGVTGAPFVAPETSVGVMSAPFVAPDVGTSPAKLDRNEPEKAAVSSQNEGTISRREPKTDSLSQPAEKPSVKLPPGQTEALKAGSPPPMIGKPMPPRLAPVQASAASATSRVSPERKAGPKSKRGRDPFTSDHESSSVDAIQVTIGRVEVRAIYPPAQPTPSRPPPKPTLSLDDYLRSRNGGKR